jgi:dolichol-phosphate mannosyltransferase
MVLGLMENPSSNAAVLTSLPQVDYSELTVILPTLNEAGNVKPLSDEIFRQAPGSKIIVVDDSSDDETGAVALSIHRLNPNLSLIERKVERCLTDSINDGVRAAQTPFIAWMDADLSHPPALLHEMLEQARIHGCCVASRFLGNNRASEIGDSLAQALLSSFLNWTIHKVLGLRTTDYTSGFIVLRRDLLADHDLVGDYGEYFIELLYFLERNGVQVKEVPYESPPRVWGESKTGTTIFKLAQRGIKYISVVLRLVVTNVLHPSKKKERNNSREFQSR